VRCKIEHREIFNCKLEKKEFARDKQALATKLERHIEEIKESLETLMNVCIVDNLDS